jgi:hypothetical protein
VKLKGPVAIFGLDVRYETLGIVRTAHLAVEPPAHLRCGAR